MPTAGTPTVREIALQKGVRSTILGIVVSGVLVLTKGVAGVLGNSYALIADAIESASDILSSIVVLAGLKVAAKPADENHPYGHGKAEPLAAMLVAVALYIAAGTIAVHSVGEIRTPHHAPAPFTLVVLVLVVLAKETLFRFVHRVGTELQSTVVRADAWHHRSDAFTSFAAFVGISVALIGGKGYESADDWAALLASAIIAMNATMLLKPAIEELTDAAPDSSIEARIRQIAEAVPGVMFLDKCRVRKLGFDYFVDLDVVVFGDITVREGHRIGHAVQDAVRDGEPMINKVLVHVEPHDETKRGERRRPR